MCGVWKGGVQNEADTCQLAHVPHGCPLSTRSTPAACVFACQKVLPAAGGHLAGPSAQSRLPNLLPPSTHSTPRGRICQPAPVQQVHIKIGEGSREGTEAVE
eukprot:282115-Chlamydomonas_euryale.AAC.3